MRAAEKIIEGLTQFLEGYLALQQNVEAELGSEESYSADEEESETSEEVDAAMVTEIRATIESVMDAEDYSAEEFATAVSTLTDALEEIDPDLFTEEEEEEEEESSYEDDDDEEIEDYDDYEEFEEEEDEDEDDSYDDEDEY